jgi:protein gp37
MNTIPILSEIIADYPEFSGIHPIADCFPMKPDAEFWELVENIRKDGVVDPILREKGTNLLIDGRNRLLALSITNSLFRVADVEPGFIMATVVAKNLHGKQHTASQRAMIAENLLPFCRDEAKERQKGGQGGVLLPQKVAGAKNSDARAAAGKAANVNHTYVDKASDIALVDKKLAADVLNGKVTIGVAHAQIKEQAKVSKAEVKAIKAKAKPITLSNEKPQVGIVTAKGVVKLIDAPEKPVFNGTNDSVSWANWTWNPVTGCEHGCKFCYARAIATSERMKSVYPFEFEPAFHEYRLACPANTKPPKTNEERDKRVFVCSMADLFGKWVPDDWIQKVFKACADSPQWEYLFLTKWPKRYSMLATLPKAWFGASVIKQGDVERIERDMTAFPVHAGIVRWISLEPMLEPIVFNDLSWCDLVVIGSQTGTNQPDGWVAPFAPNFEWVADVVAQCRAANVPYYLKPNLAAEPGMKLTQMEPRRK